jgi:hypothetical protein
MHIEAGNVFADWNDMVPVPLRVTEVNQGCDWDEEVERELEHLEIGTCHDSLS